MPNIRDFTAPIEGFTPSDRGPQALANAGRQIARSFDSAAEATAQTGARYGSAVKQAGEVAVQYAEHREVSQGAAAYAKLNDNLTNLWNDTAKNADPNDPAVAAKFHEEVLEPALEKYRESFLTEGGQKFAEARVDAIRNHMFTKTSADMSTLAAAAVSKNVHETSNDLSNTASRDPSSVPHLLESIDSTVGALVESSPNIKGTDAAKAKIGLTEKMRENIVKAGAIGAIAKSTDPERTAQEWGERYSKYISGDELKMLSANARQQIRADRQDKAYADHLQKIAVQDQSDATETAYLQKVYSDDPKVQGQVSAKAIVNDPTLNRVAKERMINLVNREMKPETDARISARTSVDIMRSMRDPNFDPQKVNDMILEARTKDPGSQGSLNKTDFTDLQKQLADIKTPQGQALAQDRGEFFKRFAASIDPSMGDPTSMQFGHHTALGEQKMYMAEKDARRMEDDLKRQNKDPHSLYDPASPDFFGRPANIMKYRASLQDSVNYQKQISTQITQPDGGSNFKPPSGWQYSPSRQQYRDPSGAVFDMNGKSVGDKRSDAGEGIGAKIMKVVSLLNPVSSAEASEASDWFQQRDGESREAWDDRTKPVAEEISPLIKKYVEKIGKPVERWSAGDIVRFQYSAEVNKIIRAQPKPKR